jgi:DNA polymerase-4
VTNQIYETACQLFDELWNGTPIRQLGVQTSRATEEQTFQYNLFESDKFERLSKLDKAIDSIRSKYGEDAVQRAVFVKNKQDHMTGGIDKAKRTGITKGVEPDAY